MNETKIPFNRLNDVYVKALLGDENKKNLTLDFINSTLERTGDRAFTDLQFINKEQEPPFEHGKVTILDILAEKSNERIPGSCIFLPGAAIQKGELSP